MANLAAETKDMGFRLEQVQDFTPTPMTVATIIYYTGVHPYTLKPAYTAKTKDEKRNQHMFFFWHKKQFRHKIRKKLEKLNRPDLVEKLLEKREDRRFQGKNKRKSSSGQSKRNRHKNKSKRGGR